MKDEIKEIERILATSGKYITYAERCYVLDCITNLQEKLKEYKMLFDAFSKRPYAHRYLEEKKKELGNSKIIGLDSEMIYKDYYDLQEENKQTKLLKEKYQLEKEIYKLKIDKAIEYINKTSFYYKSHYDFKNDLLNILNGDDKYE